MMYMFFLHITIEKYTRQHINTQWKWKDSDFQNVYISVYLHVFIFWCICILYICFLHTFIGNWLKMSVGFQICCRRSHGTHVHESWHTRSWVMAHTFMSHGTHVHESWHTREWHARAGADGRGGAIIPRTRHDDHTQHLGHTYLDDTRTLLESQQDAPNLHTH